MKSSRALMSALRGVVGLMLVLAAWYVVSRAGWISSAILPNPLTVVAVGGQMLPTADFVGHVVTSVGRIVAGFSVGAALGVLLGVVLGASATAMSALRPLVEVLRPIPPLAWIPLAIIWFGIGETSKVFVIAIGSFFPVLVNTHKGVSQIDPVLVRAARSLDVTGWQALFRVYLPGALPDITTGLRIGWSIAFAVLVAAEMIAASSGLGYFIMNSMMLGFFDRVVLGVLVLGACSLVTDQGWRMVISRLLRWYPGINSGRF